MRPHRRAHTHIHTLSLSHTHARRTHTHTHTKIEKKRLHSVWLGLREGLSVRVRRPCGPPLRPVMSHRCPRAHTYIHTHKHRHMHAHECPAPQTLTYTYILTHMCMYVHTSYSITFKRPAAYCSSWVLVSHTHHMLSSCCEWV